MYVYQQFIWKNNTQYLSPVGWACRIHWLYLCKGIWPLSNLFPGYDTKPYDGEDLLLEICGISFYCHYSQVHSDIVVVPVKVSSMGQIELLFWIWLLTTSGGTALFGWAYNMLNSSIGSYCDVSVLEFWVVLNTLSLLLLLLLDRNTWDHITAQIICIW